MTAIAGMSRRGQPPPAPIAAEVSGRKAVLLPDWDDAYDDASKITRMIRGLAERAICGDYGKEENADLYRWLAERLETCHERLDAAVVLVPQPGS